MKKFAVLFVCLGNICRSPSAEAVFRHALLEQGIEEVVETDSAGVDAYHVGQSPDSRAQETARARGYDLSKIRARKIVSRDFSRFDLILAMDKQVLSSLRHLCTNENTDRLKLFMSFAEACAEDEVPDPYYGGSNGFEQVLDLIEAANKGLIKAVKERVAVR